MENYLPTSFINIVFVYPLELLLEIIFKIVLRAGPIVSRQVTEREGVYRWAWGEGSLGFVATGGGVWCRGGAEESLL